MIRHGETRKLNQSSTCNCLSNQGANSLCVAHVCRWETELNRVSSATSTVITKINQWRQWVRQLIRNQTTTDVTYLTFFCACLQLRNVPKSCANDLYTRPYLLNAARYFADPQHHVHIIKQPLNYTYTEMYQCCGSVLVSMQTRILILLLSSMLIRIRIQVAKPMRIHSDLDRIPDRLFSKNK